MNVPIIYSPHKIGLKKNSLDYLFVPLSISSVVRSNPNSDVFFLNVNDNYDVHVPGVRNEDVRLSYENSCKEIRDVYQHLSTNQPEFELFCIERFFVLRDFCRANKIKQAFIVETDVLVFHDLNSLLLSGCINSEKVYLSEGKCISLAYVTLDYLEYYCEYVISCYESPQKFTKIKDFIARYHGSGGKGGVCDMTFCDYINKGAYGAKREYSALNLSDVFDTSSGKKILFDSFIGRDGILGSDIKFEMENSYIDGKVIKKVKNHSEGLLVQTNLGTEIQLGSLHCQGNAKGLMADFYTKYFI